MSNTVTINRDSDRLGLTAQSDGSILVDLSTADPGVALTGLAVPGTQLRAALEELVPAGSYTRTDEPNDTPDCADEQGEYICTREDGHDGPHIAATVVLNNSVGAVWGDTGEDPLEAAAARLTKFALDMGVIERATDQADALAQLKALGDDGTALRCAVMIAQAGAGEGTVAEFCGQVARGEDVNVAARAEEAEQALAEMTALRDKSRDTAIKWQVEANRLRAAQPHPLTADDAMVRRGANVLREIVSLGYPIQASEIERLAAVEKILDAALTEPTRPEGAEGVQRLIEEYTGPGGADFADYLAARLTDATVTEVES